ncbi:hypothetical protein ACTQ6A_03035 [Lachnospiraceae bacterium LCP25S3_G4]
MTKQKRGFWLFIFSLLPGAGELYMGFKKQGLSIMTIFWGIIAIASGLGFGFILMGLPIIWFYSFFNVHNLKTLSEEEFYSIEDDYVLHVDRLIEDKENFLRKYRKLIAIVLIIGGLSLLWNTMENMLYFVLPDFLMDVIGIISRGVPQIAVAIGFIWLGLHMIMGKRKELEMNENA